MQIIHNIWLSEYSGKEKKEMKKLKKKAEISRKTIERFYCRCGCGCLLWFNTSTTATSAKEKSN